MVGVDGRAGISPNTLRKRRSRRDARQDGQEHRGRQREAGGSAV
jgi:hypothetical protein